MTDRSALAIGAASAALVGLGAIFGARIARAFASEPRESLSVGEAVKPLRAAPSRLLILAPSECTGINFSNAVDAVSALNSMPPGPVALAIHTLGGDSSAVTYLARAIRNSPHQVTVYVPYVAMSGGTVLALAADDIVMDQSAILGPVDPQYMGIPAHLLKELIGTKPIEHLDEQYFILGRLADQALGESRVLLDEFGLPDAVIERVLNGNTTHGFPITFNEALELGIPVRDGVPAQIKEAVNDAIAHRRSSRSRFFFIG